VKKRYLVTLSKKYVYLKFAFGTIEEVAAFIDNALNSYQTDADDDTDGDDGFSIKVGRI
jgi:hypothetical protein